MILTNTEINKSSYEHKPVLLNDVIKSFSVFAEAPKWLVDGTFGRGGHTKALLQEYPGLKILALDIDHEALEHGKAAFAEEQAQQKIHFYRCDFSQWESVMAHFKEISGLTTVDGILLDLGVSSPQLDNPERGFSFYKDGPLDMRMDHRQNLTASEVVNTWEPSDLVNAFRDLGEIKSPEKVVRKIVEQRSRSPFKTTLELAGLIEREMGWRKRGFHPATQFFMALRLIVNSELNKISTVIPLMIASLANGGVLSVITFHSLEDRIVKYKFKDQLAAGSLINKKVIKPEWSEQKKNVRARSAKLRSFLKEQQ